MKVVLQYFIVLFFVFWGSQGISASPTINSYSNGKLHLKVCGFRTGSKYQVNYYVNGSYKTQGKFDSNSGCFEKQVSSSPGDNVVVKILNYNGSGSHKTMSYTVPGSSGRSNGGSSDRYNGDSSNDDDYQPPQKDYYSTDIIRAEAQNQARMTANWVVENYGKMENFRRAYAYGLRDGVSREIRWQNNNSWISEHNSHYVTGKNRGFSEGESQGTNRGAQVGQSKGRSDAKNRFSAVLNSGQSPDLSLSVPPTPTINGKPKINKPTTLEQRIKAQNQAASQQISRHNQFSYLYNYHSGYSDELFLYELFYGGDYKHELTSSWYRDEWAFDLWKSGKMESMKGKSYANFRKNYNKYTDSYSTTNSHENRKIYESAFKQEYELVIDSKWYSVVTNAYSQEAILGKSLGLEAGVRIAQEYSRDTNTYEGYTEGYNRGFQQGIHSSFSDSYTHAFNSTARSISNSVVIHDDAIVSLANEAGELAIGPGTSLTLDITQLTNLGGGTSQGVPVTISGTVQGAKSNSVNVDYTYSTKRLDISLQDIATVRRLEVGDKVAVEVSVGDFEKTFREAVTISSVIRSAAKQNNPSVALGTLLRALKKEWDGSNSGGGLSTDAKNKENSYRSKSDKVPYYASFIRTMKQLPSEEKNKLKALVLKRLTEFYGAREKDPAWGTAWASSADERNGNRDDIKSEIQRL